MTYAQKLKDPRWQKKRLKVLEAANWMCEACGETKETLHVHHDKYSNNPWDAPLNKLHCLCEKCHKFFHDIGIKFSEWDEFLQIGALIEPLEEVLSDAIKQNKKINNLKLTDNELCGLSIKLAIRLNADTEWSPYL